MRGGVEGEVEGGQWLSNWGPEDFLFDENDVADDSAVFPDDFPDIHGL
jgi:hypothetical protein